MFTPVNIGPWTRTAVYTRIPTNFARIPTNFLMGVAAGIPTLVIPDQFVDSKLQYMS